MMPVKYVVREGVRFAFQSSRSVALVLLDSALEVSLDLFLIAMAFSEPSTIEHAYSTLDVDGPIELFETHVQSLLDRRILEQERERDIPSLLSLLSPRVELSLVAAHLRRGDLVVIPDAFPVDLAESIRADLLTASWKTSQSQGFTYSAVESLEGRSPILTKIHDMWQASKQDMTNLSGEDCSGESRASGSWYRPGDFATPHNDSAAGRKVVAFNWYLAKDWKPEWGGSLFWCPSGQHVYPLFNTLVMFRVSPSNLHAVCNVSPFAMGQRLAINGFWNRPVDFDPLLAPATQERRLVTQPAYLFDDDRSAVVVL